MHMAGQRRTVGHDGVVADLAVVRHMHIGHDPVVAADAGDAGILRGAQVEGAEFAYGVVVADLKARRFACVFLVLRDLAERAELKDAVMRPMRGMPARSPHADRPSARTDLDMFADDGIGADLDVVGQLRVRMNDRGWVMQVAHSTGLYRAHQFGFGTQLGRPLQRRR